MDKCPMCGYVDAVPQAQLMTNNFNRYVRKDNPNIVCVISRSDEMFTSTPKTEGAPSYVWIREDVFKGEKKEPSKITTFEGEPTTGAIDNTNENAQKAKEFAKK